MLKATDQPVLAYAHPRRPRPYWVKLGLWGVGGRAGAWAFFGLCAAATAFSMVMTFYDVRWIVGWPLSLAALWYWASIRWVDRYGSWSDASVGEA